MNAVLEVEASVTGFGALDERIFLAGQITGVEGYVESSAKALPYHTALGALGRHVSESSPDRYQPSNVTWALTEDVIGKAKKREQQVARALETIEKIVA